MSGDLNPGQFDPRVRHRTPQGPVGGNRPYQQSVVGRNERTYYVTRRPDESISAFTEEPFEYVGNLSTWNWEGRKQIHKVRVSEEHQRQGVATAMLDLARKYDPDLGHASAVALSPEGKAWSEAPTVTKPLNPSQFLYHGTRAEHVEGIRNEGLRPPAGVNPHRWFMLTTSKEQAKRYAPSGDKAVLTYDIPEHERGEYLGAGVEHNVYGHEATAHGVLKPLPAKYIVD